MIPVTEGSAPFLRPSPPGTTGNHPVIHTIQHTAPLRGTLDHQAPSLTISHHTAQPITTSSFHAKRSISHLRPLHHPAQSLITAHRARHHQTTSPSIIPSYPDNSSTPSISENHRTSRHYPASSFTT